MSSAALYRWSGEDLVAIDYCDPHEYTIQAADSLLVEDGAAFALGMHRDRFLAAAARRAEGLDGHEPATVEAFWDAALAAIPAEGRWFPRVELQSRAGAAHLLFRHRTAPDAMRSAVLATHRGSDPRRAPETKGPDLPALLRLRTEAQAAGADDAVILSTDGSVVDGATSAIVWWRGEILCAPPEGPDHPGFARVDSVTARSLFGLAAALGVPTHREAATPAELDGTEVWALNALHGIRIVTAWLDGPDRDGPSPAELPGRLALWRERRHALLKPIRQEAA
jgi:branched-subunit amino acid aminotransferase/4-amino-4-deoxychorismate lyase